MWCVLSTIGVVVLILAVEASVISPWEGDVTEWQLNNLNEGDCKRDLNEYREALLHYNPTDNLWALQMFDSTAKVPNGILVLNFVHFGVYHECLAVRHPTKRFQGKHCMLAMDLATIQLPSRMDGFFETATQPRPIEPQNRQLPRGVSTFKYGVCVPSTCSAKDLNAILKATKIKADDFNCWTDEEKSVGTLAVVFISVCAVLLVLTVLSTLYHYLRIHQERTPNRLLCAFSLVLNVSKLLEIKSDGELNMGCLHGIRTLSMMWVVLCHTYTHQIPYAFVNRDIKPTITRGLAHVPITNGFFSVDSFLFLSGLLIAFVFFRNINLSGGHDVLTSCIHRWIRLTPPFAMMIFATVAILPESGSGPLWHDIISTEVDGCRENWWSSLLYLQNYIRPDSQCLGQSWYLSADMQMFWISPLILYPILLWPTYGTAFLGILIVASTLWTFALDYDKEYKASFLLTTDVNQFKYDYIATHMRMPSWLMGIACGVVICAIKARRIPIRMTTLQILLGWTINTCLFLGIIFSIYYFQRNPDAPPVESALYLSLTRLGWGIGLFWIVFACIHGYGGVINSFLSLGIWQPLGKLSYGVFLVHKTYLIYKPAISQSNLAFSDVYAVNDYFGTLVVANLLALIMYLTIEAPFVVMDQEILKSLHIFQYPRPKSTTSQSKEGQFVKSTPDKMA